MQIEQGQKKNTITYRRKKFNPPCVFLVVWTYEILHGIYSTLKMSANLEQYECDNFLSFLDAILYCMQCILRSHFKLIFHILQRHIRLLQIKSWEPQILHVKCIKKCYVTDFHKFQRLLLRLIKVMIWKLHVMYIINKSKRFEYSILLFSVEHLRIFVHDPIKTPDCLKWKSDVRQLKTWRCVP